VTIHSSDDRSHSIHGPVFVLVFVGVLPGRDAHQIARPTIASKVATQNHHIPVPYPEPFDPIVESAVSRTVVEKMSVGSRNNCNKTILHFSTIMETPFQLGRDPFFILRCAKKVPVKSGRGDERKRDNGTMGQWDASFSVKKLP
jgi:hypothetical protein